MAEDRQPKDDERQQRQSKLAEAERQQVQKQAERFNARQRPEVKDA